MGALISQAVADQLRQFPGSQDPRPSPPALLQQVLNPSGPSRPMWMAPVMENQQLMTTGMDPNLSPAYREAINQALNRDALRTVLAFGGGGEGGPPDDVAAAQQRWRVLSMLKKGAKDYEPMTEEELAANPLTAEGAAKPAASLKTEPEGRFLYHSTALRRNVTGGRTPEQILENIRKRGFSGGWFSKKPVFEGPWIAIAKEDLPAGGAVDWRNEDYIHPWLKSMSAVDPAKFGVTIPPEKIYLADKTGRIIGRLLPEKK